MMKKLLMVAVFALCAGGSFTSSAEVITWTGAAGDHKWETGGNWDLNRVPNVATDDIVVGPFDELTVISNFNRAAYTIDKSLTVKRNARMRWTTTYGYQQRNRRVSIADIGPSEHPRPIPGLMLMVW